MARRKRRPISADGPLLLELVDWVDAHTVNETWGDVKFPADVEPAPCKSVGYVVFEDAKVVMLCPHIGIDGGKVTTGFGDIVVPKAIITKRTRLSQR